MIIKKVYHEFFFYRSNRFRIYVIAKQGAVNYLGFSGGGGEKQTNKEKLEQVQVHIDK